MPLTQEENIVKDLTEKFAYLKDRVKIQRERRLWLEVDKDRFDEVFDYIVKKMDFPVLCTVTGLDEGATLAAIYHLAQLKGMTIHLKTRVSKDKPVLKSIISYFPGAECYEREIVDLLGFQVEGLPAGHRYPLTDDWPVGQFPLRKDWKKEMLDKKEGV